MAPNNQMLTVGGITSKLWFSLKLCLRERGRGERERERKERERERESICRSERVIWQVGIK